MKEQESRLFLALFSVLWLIALAGCPRSRDASQDMVTFTAAGELHPVVNGSPIFAAGRREHALREVSPLFLERDLVLVDLSGGIDIGCQPLMREEVYRWPAEWLPLLHQANIRVLNLADDHSLDCGREPLLYAVNSLLGQGFYVVGAGRDQEEAHAPVYLTRRGITLSIAAYSFVHPPGVDFCAECTGPSMYKREALIEALKEMKRRADFSLVVFHRPELEHPGMSEEELAAARQAVDFGADLVLGYGPSAAGGLHRIRGRWVIGSLGKLTGPGSMDPAKAADGLLVSAEFTPERMMNLRIMAVMIDHGAPVALRGEEGNAALSKMTAASESEVQDNASLIEDILYLK